MGAFTPATSKTGVKLQYIALFYLFFLSRFTYMLGYNSVSKNRVDEQFDAGHYKPFAQGPRSAENK